MKKILLVILSIFVFGFAFSQTGNDTTKYTWYKYTYGNRSQRYWADSVLDVPKDTIFSKYGLARISNNLYVGTGTRWWSIPSSGSVGVVDSAAYYTYTPLTDSTFRLNRRNGINDVVTLLGGAKYVDPLTTNGDIVARVSGVTTRLAKGSNNTVLGVNGSGLLSYNLLTNSNLSGSAGITNANLANSTITINGASTALGGSTSVTDATLSTSNITTNNATTSKHGFVPILPNDPTKFYDGQGNFTVPPGTGGFSNPMTTQYDIIIGGVSGTPTRLAKGADGSVLNVVSGVLQYSSYSTYGVNGVHFNLAGDSLKFGGTLIENTQLTGAFSLDFSGLSSLKFTSGTVTTKTAVSTDSMLLRDNAGRVWVAAVPSGSGGSVLDSVQVYSSGTTLTQATLANIIQLNPSSTQSTLTITTATSANWPVANNLYIIPGGTVTSGTVITTLTITAGAGLTIVDDIPPTTIQVGHPLQYRRIGTLVYRIKN